MSESSAHVPRMDPGEYFARESTEDRQARFERIYAELEKHYEARYELNHRNAFEMLIATVLAARSPDARVNELTPTLFEQYPDAAAMAKASPEELEAYTHGIMSYRQKARYLVELARRLVEHHNGEVPQDLKALTELPGVAQKTATMVLGTCFEIQAGVAVDGHVARTSQRLALAASNDAKTVERHLRELSPQQQWTALSQRLVLHGRYTCTARKPRCERCPLFPECPSRSSE